MTMDADRELLSPVETARRLSLGRTKVFELIAKGEIPSVRVGKLRRVPARALRSYVDELVATQIGSKGDGAAKASRAPDPARKTATGS
jgi:excisionase family DNA binding protein